MDDVRPSRIEPHMTDGRRKPISLGSSVLNRMIRDRAVAPIIGRPIVGVSARSQ